MHDSARCRWAGFLAFALFASAGASGPATGRSTSPADDRPRHRAEWRASTFEPSTQAQAALAVDHRGSIHVVWSSRRQQGGRYGVYGRRFTPDGLAMGGERELNLFTASHQSAPAVAIGATNVGDGDGSMRTAAVTWVAWQSHGQDGDAGAIIARRFVDWNGGGDEILVNETTRGHQFDPVIAALPGGGAIVAWTSTGETGDATRVRLRRLDAAAAPVGEELTLAGGDGQRTPALAVNADGSFVVVWAETDHARHPARILLQRVAAGGAAIGPPVDVSEAGPAPIEPAVAVSDRGALVAWLDLDGGRPVLRARLFDPAAAPCGDAFTLETEPAAAVSGVAVTAGEDGGFVVAYNVRRADGERAVLAQPISGDGAAGGRPVEITGHGSARRSLRTGAATSRVATGPDGAIVCAWSGDGGLGDASAVHVTVVSRTPNAVPPRSPGADRTAARSTTSKMTDAKPHEPPVYDPARAGREVREVLLAPGGTGFTGIFNTGWTPPDPQMGVGPDHVVLITNGAIQFFTKAGVLQFSQPIEDSFGFWGSLGATSFVFDPEVLYDDLSGRFFAMASDKSTQDGRSYVLVAVSDDSNPNGAWHKYRFETTLLSGGTFDSPNIGVDDAVVYITGDRGGSSTVYPVYTFDKASLLAGLPPAITRATTLPTSTESAGIPPVSYGAPPAYYMVEHREASTSTSVRLIALQDPLGTPSFTTINVTVPAYGRPEDPPQAGTSARPETFDARFWSVAFRNGSLWATHHINDDRVLARWYEFAMNGWPDSGRPPTLVQSGEIDPGPGVRTFFSAITVDDVGNAAIVYARSAGSEFISMETAQRFKSDPPGTFRPGVNRRTSSGPYTAERWGDYGSIEIDPVDGKTVWAHHEYADGSDWRTWVQSFTHDFPPGDVNCDGAVGFADLLLVLSQWGPCAGCPADLDGNGDVGFPDLLIVLSNWS